MDLINLFNHFDTQLQSVKKANSKRNILFNMFLIECKYNLDILDLIKGDCDKADPQIRELIKLLSISGIERIISEKNILTSDSFLTELGSTVIEKLKSNFSENIENIEDAILFNIYKRILVLKAISNIQQPFTAIKNINTLARIKHLKKLLIVISKSRFK